MYSFSPSVQWAERVGGPLFHPTVLMGEREYPTVSPHRIDGEKEFTPHSFTALYRWRERESLPSLAGTLFLPEMIMSFHEYTYQDREFIIRAIHTKHAQCTCQLVTKHYTYGSSCSRLHIRFHSHSEHICDQVA